MDDDYDWLHGIAKQLNESINTGSYYPDELRAVQKEVTRLSKKLLDNERSKRDYIIYECQALIDILKGEDEEARKNAQIARNLCGGRLQSSNVQSILEDTTSGKTKNYWYVWFIVGILLMGFGGMMKSMIGTFVGIVGIVSVLNGIVNIFTKRR